GWISRLETLANRCELEQDALKLLVWLACHLPAHLLDSGSGLTFGERQAQQGAARKRCRVSHHLPCRQGTRQAIAAAQYRKRAQAVERSRQLLQTAAGLFVPALERRAQPCRRGAELVVQRGHLAAGVA